MGSRWISAQEYVGRVDEAQGADEYAAGSFGGKGRMTVGNSEMDWRAWAIDVTQVTTYKFTGEPAEAEHQVGHRGPASIILQCGQLTSRRGKDFADVYVQRNAGSEDGRLEVALRRGELTS